jgi:hypothetical protein
MLPHSELWDCLTQTKLEITALQHADLSTRKHSKDKLIARLWENARKDWKLQLLGNTGADVSAHQACFQTTLLGKHNPWLQRTSSRAQNVWDNEGKPNNIFSLLWSLPLSTQQTQHGDVSKGSSGYISMLQVPLRDAVCLLVHKNSKQNWFSVMELAEIQYFEQG